jgi:hypothetical protein
MVARGTRARVARVAVTMHFTADARKTFCFCMCAQNCFFTHRQHHASRRCNASASASRRAPWTDGPSSMPVRLRSVRALSQQQEGRTQHAAAHRYAPFL